MTTSTAPYTTTALDSCKQCGTGIIGAVNQYCELCSVCLRAKDARAVLAERAFEGMVKAAMAQRRQRLPSTYVTEVTREAERRLANYAYYFARSGSGRQST